MFDTLIRNSALRYARRHGYLGEQLPLGWRHNAEECPLARATGSKMVVPDFMTGVERFGLGVTLFISRFDRGHYNDLATSAAEEWHQRAAIARADDRELVTA